MRNLPTRDNHRRTHHYCLGTRADNGCIQESPGPNLQNCGEEYVSAEANEALLSQAHTEWERGITLEMLDFAA